MSNAGIASNALAARSIELCGRQLDTRNNAEHGGFGYSDTGVGLLVSNPSIAGKVLKTPVASSQVAPTILRYLGLDPESLKSVRDEKTTALPGLGLED